MSYVTQDIDVLFASDMAEIKHNNKKKYGNIFEDDIDYLDEEKCIEKTTGKKVITNNIFV